MYRYYFGVPIFRKLIDELHKKSVAVYLVSGGFRGVIGPIALELNIPLQNIYANKLKFFFNGKYILLMKYFYLYLYTSCNVSFDIID